MSKDRSPDGSGISRSAKEEIAYSRGVNVL
jgi:hypothetical protein